MIRRTLIALVVATIPVMAQIGPPSAGTACTSLAALTIPTVTIKSANLVAAGPFTPPSSADSPAATVSLPAHCRIEATARPTSDSEIKFEVWIPPAEAWNGKLEGVGNGGYSGAL
jgi:feruloyl esterase